MKRSVIWLGALAISIGIVGCTSQQTDVATTDKPAPVATTAQENGSSQVSAEAFAIRGVIEGFYGKPWTNEQRTKMFTFMAKQQFNTYVYAPKDDPYQRLQWADLYPEADAKSMKALVGAAEGQGIRFVYSISPGIPIPLPSKPVTPEIEQKSITFSSQGDREKLLAKIGQLREMGVHTFMLSFDDVKEGMKDKDRGFYGTDYAAAHMELANAVLQAGKAADPKFELWFAPTKYSGVKDNSYWQTLRGKLDPSIQVIWTGPAILSKSITSAQADQVAKWLGRKPLIWDNYPVNDYTYEINKHPQLLMGPIEARDADLGQHTAGLLANPMIQPEASKLALYTIGEYLQSPKTYKPEEAWVEAYQKLEGVEGREGMILFSMYSRSSMLREENERFKTLATAYWKEYGSGKTEQQALMRKELTSVRDLRQTLQQEANDSNKELLTEIEPWAKKLAEQGELGLLALEMLELDKSNPKRQELRDKLQTALRQINNDPLTIGEEIVQFAKVALEK